MPVSQRLKGFDVGLKALMEESLDLLDEAGLEHPVDAAVDSSIELGTG